MGRAAREKSVAREADIIGAIAGDIIGSPYEHRDATTRDFPLFRSACTYTDDTVLALAVAEAIVDGRPYADLLREFGKLYPSAGYGGNFYRWIFTPGAGPYNSWGNGSGMRVPAVGFLFDDESTVLKEAEKSALPTHNHPEGIKGAQAVALSIFLARRSEKKDAIRSTIEKRFDYDLQRTLDDIRPSYGFDVSCQGSVPEAIIAFLDSGTFEDCIREAVYLGGDSDTIAAMAGGIAEAWYGGIPADISAEVLNRLPKHLLAVYQKFLTRLTGSRKYKGVGTVVGRLK